MIPNSFLTWIDLTASDRDRIRRVLDLLSEQGTVDELGLGSLRDLLSDTLFPGTSSLHTRLRYFLFIPWVYRDIEARGRGLDVGSEVRRLEIQLINALLEAGEYRGVIGVLARENLARLPSNAYWAGLVGWGIFMPAQTQSWYHTHFDSLAKRRNDIGRSDDPGVTWTRAPTWHPRLPPAPPDFLTSVSFELTSEEAGFMQGRIEDRCPGSLLAWLAREGSTQPAAVPWEDPDALRAGPEVAEVLELARRFSMHMEGAPLLYNLMLAEKRYASEHTDADQARIDRYRAELAEWARREADEPPFDLQQLWAFAARRGARQVHMQREFIRNWRDRIVHIGAGRGADDAYLRTLIERRETQLKGPRRARLVNHGRLLDWSGEVGIGRMQFRWPQVRQLLTDLHQGLAG
ncbi:MAG: DUF6361 family protein [Aquisalimonadaceae bacterium]